LVEPGFTKSREKGVRVKRSGFTLIELLIPIFVITVTMVGWQLVARRYGPWWGIGAALSAGLLSVGAVIVFYRVMWRMDERGRQRARDSYRGIYRVIAVPTDPKHIVTLEGAEIRVGDYGWEAGPSRNDGLIYLQGLTRDWTVVWHAGLHPDEVEQVCTKPHSQYDSWHPYWADPPPLPACPFPVIERKTLTIGRPHHSHSYFVQPAVYRPYRTTPSS
jgi:hypothetical protein